nr:PREDICTED: cadherin-5 [Bos indicus]XP_019835725.1 PREDICTED: cadherin-5 [Bos indicus]
MQALVMLLATGATYYLGLLAAAAAAINPGRPNTPGSLPAHRRQKRDWIWNQMHIDEERNDSLPHYVGKIKSSVDPKKTEYQLRGESAGKVFRVDKNTGDVYALERLDREKISEYHLTALVVDKDSKKNLESPSSFTIKVHDVNDNWPVFTHRVFNASVPEMSGIGMCLVCPSPSPLTHP